MFKLSSFDLFPKVDPRYLRATSPGGFTTVLLTLVMALLTLFEVYRYMTPIPVSTILIENRVDHRLTMTLDISVASPCDALVVEVEDCHGGKVKVNSLLEATRIKFLNLNTTAEASGVTASGNTSTGSFFESLFDPMAEAGQFGSEREGCRITGTLPMDDVSGKLLITPILQLHLGFTGLSTNLKDVNLSHVIHDMSFGRPFPGRVNPLEDRMEAAPHGNLNFCIASCAVNFHVSFLYVSIFYICDPYNDDPIER